MNIHVLLYIVYTLYMYMEIYMYMYMDIYMYIVYVRIWHISKREENLHPMTCVCSSVTITVIYLANAVDGMHLKRDV